MAILHPNQTVGAPRGRVGDLIYAHYADGRVVIRLPCSGPTRIEAVFK